MRLGFITNGFAHHRIEDAIEILAEIGYRSAAVTLEREFFDPPDERGVEGAVSRLLPVLARCRMDVTIETGARFILDPRRKHQPTMVSASLEDRRRRIAFLRGAIDAASRLKAESVSLWSGVADDEARDEAQMQRLVEALGELLPFAQDRNVRLAFEPEPGMFIDTMARFAELVERVGHPLLGLTLDVGHVHCLSDGSVADHARRWKDRLWNVHIEDIRRGVHEHLMFGEGDMDIGGVLQGLQCAGYSGPVHVELSRHSHDAVRAARKAYHILQGVWPKFAA